TLRGTALAVDEAFDGQRPVDAFALPAGGARLRFDEQVVVELAAKPLDGISIARQRRIDRATDLEPDRIGEADAAVRQALAAEALLVDQPVVVAAQQHEVLQAGLSALGPVADVVAVDVVLVGAAGEPATAVA